MPVRANRYDRVIEKVFFTHFNEERPRAFFFERDELSAAAAALDLPRILNLGDAIYSYRYRTALPSAILETAPDGEEWVIRPAGQGRYQFILAKVLQISPQPTMAETKILDSTPGIIVRYAMSDEQALLAKIRYNRLIDVFTGLTCFSLQNHLRTTVQGMGQVETDEIYIGVDKRGAHYVMPVQGKGGTDRIGRIQIEQDIALCREKFPQLIAKPIAGQFIEDELIALFEFEEQDEEIRISSERHYRLVRPDSLTEEELRLYRQRTLS